MTTPTIPVYEPRGGGKCSSCPESDTRMLVTLTSPAPLETGAPDQLTACSVCDGDLTERLAERGWQ